MGTGTIRATWCSLVINRGCPRLNSIGRLCAVPLNHRLGRGNALHRRVPLRVAGQASPPSQGVDAAAGRAHRRAAEDEPRCHAGCAMAMLGGEAKTHAAAAMCKGPGEAVRPPGQRCSTSMPPRPRERPSAAPAAAALGGPRVRLCIAMYASSPPIVRAVPS